jgi:hypothetical protein
VAGPICGWLGVGQLLDSAGALLDTFLKQAKEVEERQAWEEEAETLQQVNLDCEEWCRLAVAVAQRLRLGEAGDTVLTEAPAAPAFSATQNPLEVRFSSRAMLAPPPLTHAVGGQSAGLELSGRAKPPDRLRGRAAYSRGRAAVSELM